MKGCAKLACRSDGGKELSFAGRRQSIRSAPFGLVSPRHKLEAPMPASLRTRGYRTVIAVASLVVGPLLMSVGDLLHPEETLDAAGQATIIIEHPSRWYAAHLLLFIGLLAFVPGVLAITRLTAQQKPMAGYVGRVLLLVG